MAFCFKKKESVEKAVRRMGCERVEHALDCLKDHDRAESIHCARKDIKKVRAVLRLVRGQIRKKDWRRISGELREGASYLATPRDAYVKEKTLRDLRRHFTGQLAKGALRHVRAELRHSRDEEMRRFGQGKAVRRVKRRLRRVAEEMQRLDVEGKYWKALCPGVMEAYSEGQRAYEAVVKDCSPENLHEWRKRAKDLWYQMSMLRPLWPEQMEATARKLEALGDYLGDDHDLAVLQEEVEAKAGPTSEAEALRGLIEERQAGLRAQALALGSRFYAEKPAAFTSRLAKFWQIWKDEKAPRLNQTEAKA